MIRMDLFVEASQTNRFDGYIFESNVTEPFEGWLQVAFDFNNDLLLIAVGIKFGIRNTDFVFEIFGWRLQRLWGLSMQAMRLSDVGNLFRYCQLTVFQNSNLIANSFDFVKDV